MIKRLSAALIGWAIVLGGAQQGWASPPSEDTSTIGLDGDGGPRRTDDPAPPPEVEEILASRRVARDAALRRFDVTPQGVVASELSSAVICDSTERGRSDLQLLYGQQLAASAVLQLVRARVDAHGAEPHECREDTIRTGRVGGDHMRRNRHLSRDDAFGPEWNRGRGFAWDIQWLPYTPTSADKSTYVGRLYVSILGLTGSGRRYPLIGNMYMVSGGPHAPGYSETKTYKQHVEISGFKDYGATSHVRDPASGMSGFEAVPSKYHIDSNKLVTILGARGYLY